MGKKKKADSPAIQLLNHVWLHDGGRANVQSWDRLNHSMQAALSLAIQSLMDFGLHDFEVIEERYWPGYWMGSDGGEFYYGAACNGTYGINMSACLAFEHWKVRKPFLIARKALNLSTEVRDRICVGHRFTWGEKKKGKWVGHQVTCTSMSQDGKSFTACSYHDPPEGVPWPRAKVKRRFKITHAKIAEYHAAIREFGKKEQKK